jgi:hypothetical protein
MIINVIIFNNVKNHNKHNWPIQPHIININICSIHEKTDNINYMTPQLLKFSWRYVALHWNV